MPENIECNLNFKRKLASIAIASLVLAPPVLVGTLDAPASHAQSQAATQRSAIVAGKSIHQMYLDDQAETPAGIPGGVSPVTEKEFNEHGEARRRQVRAMLSQGDVKTGEDFHDASLLFQHSDEADDYLLAHVLAVEAVITGDESSKWMAAATLDRYLQMIGRPQIFGTQYPLDPNVPIDPAADPHVARFKGRTESPFNDQLLTDTVRRDFCVPDLAQQKQNLATFNTGKYPGSAMVPPGCKR
jgi:hypothetical protein